MFLEIRDIKKSFGTDVYKRQLQTLRKPMEKMPLMTEQSRSMRHIWKKIWKRMVHDILKQR